METNMTKDEAEALIEKLKEVMGNMPSIALSKKSLCYVNELRMALAVEKISLGCITHSSQDVEIRHPYTNIIDLYAAVKRASLHLESVLDFILFKPSYDDNGDLEEGAPMEVDLYEDSGRLVWNTGWCDESYRDKVNDDWFSLDISVEISMTEKSSVFMHGCNDIFHIPENKNV